MNRTAPDAPISTTVSALSDRHLLQQLKRLTAVEHHLEIVVIDHLRELERRRLYLPLGCSSLFDYATRELGYSEAAAWRRIKAMRLCGEVEGARERMRDGSLTLNSAALLQNAFDRQERKSKQSGGGRGVQPAATSSGSAPGTGAPPLAPGAPAQTGERAEEPEAAPVLDSSARQALVEQAAGKSTRQVEKLLAGVDPELTAPADRIRPLGAGRWELKAVIDDDCQRGLEQLKGLLSHVDPHLTLGQILERVVREAVERHDPARPPRGRRTGSRAAASSGADETSAPKDVPGPSAEAAQRNAIPASVTTSAAKENASSPKDAGCEHVPATAAERPGATVRPSAPKDSTGQDSAEEAAAHRKAAPAGVTTSPAKVKAAPRQGRAVPEERPEAAARSATSAPKAKCGRQAAPPAPRPGPHVTVAAAPQSLVRGRAIPAAVKRHIWERDRGCCSYVDRDSGRRCGSRHLLQIDHILPFALGGSAAPDNLRLLCAAHHRHRHAGRGGRTDRTAARPVVPRVRRSDPGPAGHLVRVDIWMMQRARRGGADRLLAAAGKPRPTATATRLDQQADLE